METQDDRTRMIEIARQRVLEYFEDLHLDPAQGTVSIRGQRYLLIRAAALSVRFYEIIKHLYRDKGDAEAAAVTRSLLYDFAHALGAADASSFDRELLLGNLDQRLYAGTLYFAHSGWSAVEIQSESRLTPDEHFLIVAHHPTSFEAEAWLENNELSTFPVCIMNCGYPAGWCSAVFGIPLVIAEVSCRAMGDDTCRFVIAMPHKIEEHVAAFYQQRPTLARSTDRYEIPGFFNRKKMEDELREREAQYRSIFEAATDAMVIMTLDGAIVSANPAAHRVFGYAPGEMERLHGDDLRQAGGGHVLDVIRADVEQRSEFAMETMGLAKDGTLFDMELRATALSYRKQPHLLVVIRDISEQKRIEVERLRQEAERARQTERLRADLAVARSTQSSLLPSQPPWNDRQLLVANQTLPAYEIGGDFYTYIDLGARRYAVLVGDISGKGVTAALLMTLTISSIESQARQSASPAAFLHTLNQRLLDQLHACRMFAALLYVVIDLQQNTVQIANAGMIAPILVRDGMAHLLDVAGLPLGIIANLEYQETKLALQPGDSLLLVSDGVVEARNQQGELWGFERLQRAAAANHAHNPAQVIDTILADIGEYVGSAPQHDDMTLIVVQHTR